MFQGGAGKVLQPDCGQQIFRQLRGLCRLKCLPYWIDCRYRAYILAPNMSLIWIFFFLHLLSRISSYKLLHFILWGEI